MLPAFEHRDAIAALGHGSRVRTTGEAINSYGDPAALPAATTIRVDFAFSIGGAAFHGEADVDGSPQKVRIDQSQFHMIEIIEAVPAKPLFSDGWSDDEEPVAAE